MLHRTSSKKVGVRRSEKAPVLPGNKHSPDRTYSMSERTHNGAPLFAKRKLFARVTSMTRTEVSINVHYVDRGSTA